jgi:copper(I)-binding protein
VIVPAAPPAIVEAWSRPAIGTGVVYARIENHTATADVLDRARSTVAGAVELHRSMENGDMSTMVPVRDLSLPPHGTLQLEPGGAHIMLVHLHHDLHAGEHFALALHFRRAGWRTVRVTVRPI